MRAHDRAGRGDDPTEREDERSSQSSDRRSVAHRTRRAPRPQCDRGPSDRALATTTDERGTVAYCHRCGYTAADCTPSARAIERAHRGDVLERVRAIWARTVALRGTLGETYLRHRSCALPPADSDVRYLAGTAHHAPSICALVTDAITAAPMSLHFTPIAANGRGRGDRRLLAGGAKRGGVIRVWPDESVTHGIAIAEGIETALSAAHAYTPTWATIDAGNMAQLPVLDGIESLTIFADCDAAGLAAARACGRRWRDAGREVRILAPRNGDANDAIRGAA